MQHHRYNSESYQFAPNDSKDKCNLFDTIRQKKILDFRRRCLSHQTSTKVWSPEMDHYFLKLTW